MEREADGREPCIGPGASRMPSHLKDDWSGPPSPRENYLEDENERLASEITRLNEEVERLRAGLSHIARTSSDENSEEVARAALRNKDQQ